MINVWYMVIGRFVRDLSKLFFLSNYTVSSSDLEKIEAF